MSAPPMGQFSMRANNMGIIVIAVGVRTKEDLDELKVLGADAATGPIVNQ